MTVELTLSEKRLELKVESEFLCPLCKSLLYFGIQNQLEICPNSTCSNNPKDYRFADKSERRSTAIRERIRRSISESPSEN